MWFYLINISAKKYTKRLKLQYCYNRFKLRKCRDVIAHLLTCTFQKDRFLFSAVCLLIARFVIEVFDRSFWDIPWDIAKMSAKGTLSRILGSFFMKTCRIRLKKRQIPLWKIDFAFDRQMIIWTIYITRTKFRVIRLFAHDMLSKI